jgi:hypothetical protein
MFENGKEKCAQRARGGEKRNVPPCGLKPRYLRRRTLTLHLLLESARLVVEMHSRRMRMVCEQKGSQHPVRMPMAFL